MKKSEMEDHHDQHVALEDKIRRMSDNRDFPAVFSVCVESFPHIVPAIKFRKQEGIAPETPRLLGIAVICKYAPSLFAHSYMEQLLDFLKSTRPLAKHENRYLEDAEAAFGREETARVIWNHVERHPGTLQRDISKVLGIDHDAAVEIVDIWEHLGVIVRQKESSSYGLQLRTQLDAEVEGFCLACGVHGKGRKELFFKSMPCKRCGSDGFYHIRYVDPQ
jgi:hypothetical protein